MSHSILLAMQPHAIVKRGIRVAPRRREPGTPFRWPLDSFGARAPRVLAVYDGERPSVDLGYEHVLTQPVPVLAANDGEVSFALDGGTGCAVSLDHGGTWCTHYTGLRTLDVIPCLPRINRRQSVRAGEVIGYTANKLGFELWRWTADRGFVAVDPRPHLATWAGTNDATTEAA